MRTEYEFLLSTKPEPDYSNVVFLRSMKDAMAPDDAFDTMINFFAAYEQSEAKKEKKTLYRRKTVAPGAVQGPVVLEAAGEELSRCVPSFNTLPCALRPAPCALRPVPCALCNAHDF